MKKRLLLFLCIFTLLLSTAAQAEDVTADVPAPAPSAEKADTLSPFARTRSYDGASRMWTPRRGITTPSLRCTNTV